MTEKCLSMRSPGRKDQSEVGVHEVADYNLDR